MDSERLNVVLVVLEGARADHFGCYGYERDTTPFLDQLATEGVRFTHAFTPAPAALAAHASILTGLPASVHGATEESGALAAPLPLLSAHLKSAGYRTAAFCPNPAVGPQAGLGSGFDRFASRRAGGRLTGRAADYARRASDRVLGRSDAGARRTTEAVREWALAESTPFFAYVVYSEPAEPACTPAPYDRLFAAAGAARATDGHALAVARYDGALRYADLRIKELADALAAAGLYDRSLVIITATHGSVQRPNESALADGALRVPLLLRCPARIPRGYVVDAFAQATDLAPTVLAFAGVVLDGSIGAGRVLVGPDGATAGPDAIIAESYRTAPDGNGRPTGVRRKAVRTRREKFIWQSDEINALFDLSRDPHEEHNLVAEDVERADRLRRRLFDCVAANERLADTVGATVGHDAGDGVREQQGARE